MRLRIGLTFIITTFLYSFSSASISENFAKAGILIDGSGSFEVYEPNGDQYYRLTGSGRTGFFLIDGLLPNISIGYGHYGFNKKSLLPNEVILNNEVMLNAGAIWYFGYPRNAKAGIAHSIGLSLANDFHFYGNGTSDYTLGLQPEYVIYLFLAQRVAPFIKIASRTFFKKNYNPEIGDMRIYFGFAYFLPTKDQVLIKK